MAAFTLVGLVNIILIMAGVITPFRIVMIFNVSVLTNELLHWIFCWQYYKSSIEIRILLGLKVGDVQKTSKKLNGINILVISLLILTTLAEMGFFVVEQVSGGGGKRILKHFYILGIIPNLFGTLCTVVLCLALIRISRTIKS